MPQSTNQTIAMAIGWAVAVVLILVIAKTDSKRRRDRGEDTWGSDTGTGTLLVTALLCGIFALPLHFYSSRKAVNRGGAGLLIGLAWTIVVYAITFGVMLAANLVLGP